MGNEMVNLKDPRLITPEEYRKAEFLRKYFPRISKIKWFFIKFVGKRQNGYSYDERRTKYQIPSHIWQWYEFRGERYYISCKDNKGNFIYKRANYQLRNKLGIGWVQ